MGGMKTNVIAWVMTLTLPVLILMGIYFFFVSQFDRGDMGKVKSDVGDNRRTLQTHSDHIDRNRETSQDNAQRLTAAEEAIGENVQAIGKNQEAIGANGKAIEAQGRTVAANGKAHRENADALDVMRKDLTARLAEMSKTVERLKTLREEELEFRKAALERMSKLQDQINALVKQIEQAGKATDKRIKDLEDRAAGPEK